MCLRARACTGWEGCGLGVDHTQHYLNGTPATNPKLFPDMKGLVDYGHKKGLKMGWYFNGCGCIEKHKPASGWDINYEGDIRQLAAYGFDGVKFDGCGRMCNMTLYAELMNQTGKAFEIGNSRKMPMSIMHLTHSSPAAGHGHVVSML